MSRFVTIPGANLGEFWIVENIPEDYFAITAMARSLVIVAETEITHMVPDAVRRVTRTSLEYSTRDGKVFMRIKPQEKSIRVLMHGTEETFVDEYGLVVGLPVAEFGRNNVEYLMKDDRNLDIFHDYLVVTLTMIDYFMPREDEPDEDDSYTIELTDGTYEGPMADGKPNGKGKFTWSDGSCYEGTVINGHVTGRGKYTRANGDVFEAYFVDGKISREVPKAETPSNKPKQLFTFGYIY